MVLSLKEFDEIDIGKLIERADILGVLQIFFRGMLNRKLFPKNIAIDNSTGDLMFIIPEIVKRDQSNNCFLVFYCGDIFEITLPQVFTDVVDIESFDKNKDAQSESLRGFITSAFDVYGRYGSGTKNTKGADEFKVSPIFMSSEYQRYW